MGNPLLILELLQLAVFLYQDKAIKVLLQLEMIHSNFNDE